MEKARRGHGQRGRDMRRREALSNFGMQLRGILTVPNKPEYPNARS